MNDLGENEKLYNDLFAFSIHAGFFPGFQNFGGSSRCINP